MAEQAEERARMTEEPVTSAGGTEAGQPAAPSESEPAAEGHGKGPAGEKAQAEGSASGGEVAAPEGEGEEETDVEGLTQELAAVREQYEQAEAARQQLWNQYLRLQADFDNYRKRIQRERETWQNQGAEEVVRQLLPVVDNLERALAAVPADGLPEGSPAQGLATGVRMVYDQFRSVLEQAGLQAVEAVGQPFDPRYHEAMDRVVAPGYEPDTVVEELQRGYLFRSKLIRPSLVRVAQAGEGQASDGEGGNNVG